MPVASVEHREVRLKPAALGCVAVNHLLKQVAKAGRLKPTERHMPCGRWSTPAGIVIRSVLRGFATRARRAMKDC